MSLASYVPPQNSDELLERYQNGERYFAGAELDGANYDLRGVVLEGADLSAAYITADFRGANLKDVLFINANLKTCDFRDAELHGTAFMGALLESTTFEGAKTDGANFAKASCYSYRFEEGEKPWW